ncbi:peptidylprolyl isomerase [Roseivivax isoporae]|uniref:Parvulin-like PPIase n=1 Tax=Roseivivax isoporae LMG 25204 TaxID=1449351 RepID=X7FF33_9RHOB|nr:peptidylprolyl isomerase [Roseivivax isoporae]ETX30686.1 peptidylprolyl isomerase [Roseivivax isoporae LMG 25204]
MLELLTTATRRLAPLVCALSLGMAALPGGAEAQNLFAPAITVNDDVITTYELQQRERMNAVLNAPGNLEELAREQLIDDRLRVAAAAREGIVPTEEQVTEGMAEFAGRANLSREEFVAALAQGGVSEQTFRDFVRAGVAWRELVRQRFGPQSQVSEVEIDRAQNAQDSGSNVRVLLSEIIIPAPPPQAEQVRALAQRISQVRSEAEFSAAAREYSATQSRGNGGRLPWQDLTDLPPVLRPIVLGLSPGEVSDPLPITNAVALFQLRGIEETGYTAPEIGAVEYAAYFMPGGRSPETLARARVLAQTVDRCDDLYGVAKGQPANVLDRQTLPPAQLPADYAIELSKLDPGEASTALTRANGQSLVFLMLCSRSSVAPQQGEDGEDAAPAREELALGLRNRRLGALADGYLAELRAEARIVER